MTSERTAPFAARHLGPRDDEIPGLLDAVGAPSLEALTDEIVPDAIRLERPLDLPAPLGERALLDELKTLAERNRPLKSLIGLGFHDSITPSVILRNVFENPGWYTQYTPYQSEISQGRLEALLNFQTLVSELTGLPVANASLLDEATAAAEAMTLLHRVRSRELIKAGADRFLVAGSVYPQTLAVLRTRAEPLGIEIIEAGHLDDDPPEGIFGALIQSPDARGALRDLSPFIERVHERGALVAVAADLMALTLVKSPGEQGADVAVGSAQRFGVPLGYGGPHAAFFATKEAYQRQVPGRIIGITRDAEGRTAYRMALQTREQHIRRERATSNICTAQALLAVMAGFYAVYHGPDGLAAIARGIHGRAVALAARLDDLGFAQMNEAFFDTLSVRLDDEDPEFSEAIRKVAVAADMNFDHTVPGRVGIALDETVTDADVARIVAVFAEASGKEAAAGAKVAEAGIADSGRTPDEPAPATSRIDGAVPPHLARTSPFLTHPVFRAHRTETRMLRYIKSLEEKDLSLTTSMIPLGSCTMKLNATSEMIPLSWPGFAAMHPFAPPEQAEGYATLIERLEDMLAGITGLDAVSLQPNSGAQGEYAGLMVIRAYHRDRGERHRDVALIPASAHGTNPASAVMAGLDVKIVKCDAGGDIDLVDLKAKAEKHADRLAALMITYPSTHGVYEERIREVCDVIHAHGGQVYLDGANMNAQVGLTSPERIGADVCHLNLHKTFSIPHGGGGPGMGPIAVKAHLAPYLPRHPLVATGGEKGLPAVSATPFGSASILIISYAYIRMMGAEGLTRASRVAMLNANYLKARLEGAYPVLYTGAKGRVAHELIFDFRPFKKSAGIEVEDVAKRLMDYGFHAPTVSFPVAGTLMVEPTESEDPVELDRFVDALLAIREEIEEVIRGRADRKDNLLKHAPHTAAAVTADAWDRPYSRERAAFPLDAQKVRKFWPPVARVDNVHGDRNFCCAW